MYIFISNSRKRLKSKNKIIIDIKQRVIRITPIDRLRNVFLKNRVVEIYFNEIVSIDVKRVSFGQYEKTNRLRVKSRTRSYDLIDFKQYSSTETLSRLLQDIVKS